jgi:hypothetical protein
VGLYLPSELLFVLNGNLRFSFNLSWSPYEVPKIIFFALSVKELAQVIVDQMYSASVHLSCWSLHKLTSLLVVSDRNVTCIKYFFTKLCLRLFKNPVLSHAIIVLVTYSDHTARLFSISDLILFA